MLKPIIFSLLLSYNAGSDHFGTIKRIEVLDPQLEKIINIDAEVELLADGMQWTEGPVWVKQGGFLLFSDPALNTIYRWDEENGLVEFIKPSGYEGTDGYSSEPGTNGLLVNHDGDLIACDHGNRRIARIDIATKQKEALVDRWDGKRFNSPNDICQHPSGDYYFTDPPYGLPDREKDTINREIEANGVYRLDKNGDVEQIISDLDRPNGIALSGDATKLYVALSDGSKPYIMEYALTDGKPTDDGKIFFDFKKHFPDESMAADGIKVDEKGNVFAAAGDGVCIISPEGEVLGRIRTGHSTANCAFSDDGYLYITASQYLFRASLVDTPVGQHMD
ncbi:MAG: SMP-30/gluconolactonase/LRE family protein [Sphingobacterium sp.]